jgi:formylglycine-generating enzyme required for sulfatase activity
MANLDPLREAEGEVKSVLEFADTDISGYGVLNLAGNVREWTASLFLDRKPGQPFTNEVLTIDLVESTPVLVVLRGGSWETVRSEGLAPRRDRNRSDEIRSTTGFRCVCLQEECTRPGELWWNLFHRP